MESLFLTTLHRLNSCVLIGFKHGCKLAIVSPATAGSAVLFTGVIHPTFSQSSPLGPRDRALLAGEMRRHGVDLVAIGNGTACRETEWMFAALIAAGEFSPAAPRYAVVSEQGASIYRFCHRFDCRPS